MKSERLEVTVIPFGPVETNGIFLACKKSKKAVVIDPGMGSKDFFLEEARKGSFHIEKILLTHSHWDHIVDVAPLKKEGKIPLFVHPLDGENVKFPGRDGLFLPIAILGVEPDGFFSDGEKIPLGELTIEVFHTPGHSPGSVCFYLEKEQILISGDTLFAGSMGNISFPTAQPDLMWKSLDRLATLPSSVRVIPGHGEETTIGQETWLKQAKEIFG